MPDYRVKYKSVYRNKEWVILSQKFSTSDDIAAFLKGCRIVRQFDKQARKRSDGLERCEVVTIRRITRKRAPERNRQLSLH